MDFDIDWKDTCTRDQAIGFKSRSTMKETIQIMNMFKNIKIDMCQIK